MNKRGSQKAVLVVRRIFDSKGFLTNTEVDIKSEKVSNVMLEINADVEGLSLRKNPPLVDHKFHISIPAK